GMRVASYDVNPAAVSKANGGDMPFDEPRAPDKLRSTLAAGTSRATTDPAVVSTARNVVVVIGTPVDEHLNPDPTAVRHAIAQIADHLVDGQLVVLRSTVYPGVTRLVDELLSRLDRKVDVAFCPERIAEGRA